MIRLPLFGGNTGEQLCYNQSQRVKRFLFAPIWVVSAVDIMGVVLCLYTPK